MIKIPRPYDPDSGLQIYSTIGVFSDSASVILPSSILSLRLAVFIRVYS